MNRDILTGQWKHIKGDIKKHWGRLTDDEIEQIGGQFEKMVGIVQQKYGYNKEKTEQDIDHFLSRFKH